MNQPDGPDELESLEAGIASAGATANVLSQLGALKQHIRSHAFDMTN